MALQWDRAFGIIIAMHRFINKNWPLLCIALLVLTVAFFLGRARKEVVGKAVMPEVPAEGGKLEDIHFTHEGTEDGVRWSLDAKEVRFSEDRRKISFTAFKFRLEPQNRPAVHLEGKSGHYDKTAGQFLLSGNLYGRTEDGYTIVTESAVYDQQKRRLTTEDAVSITGPDLSLEGRGLAYDVATETLEIKSDVKTVINGRSWNS